MTEYHKKETSATAKTALGIGIGGLAAALGIPAVRGIVGNQWQSASGTDGNAVMLALASAIPAAIASRNTAVAASGFVSDKEMCLIRESSGKDAVIARLEAEKYTDNKVTLALAPVYGELSKQKDEICELKSALVMESERRACGDERIQTYVDGNFIKAEKSINSKKINYHGCEPVIKPVHDCCSC